MAPEERKLYLKEKSKTESNIKSRLLAYNKPEYHLLALGLFFAVGKYYIIYLFIYLFITSGALYPLFGLYMAKMQSILALPPFATFNGVVIGLQDYRFALLLYIYSYLKLLQGTGQLLLPNNVPAVGRGVPLQLLLNLLLEHMWWKFNRTTQEGPLQETADDASLLLRRHKELSWDLECQTFYRHPAGQDSHHHCVGGDGHGRFFFISRAYHRVHLRLATVSDLRAVDALYCDFLCDLR